MTVAGTYVDEWVSDDELTISQARACLEFLERRAVMNFMNKGRAVSDAVRDYMVDNFSGASTTRAEFEEAIRYMSDAKYINKVDYVD